MIRVSVVRIVSPRSGSVKMLTNYLVIWYRKVRTGCIGRSAQGSRPEVELDGPVIAGLGGTLCLNRMAQRSIDIKILCRRVSTLAYHSEDNRSAIDVYMESH